ncbi:MAG: hypothetical protein KJO95_11695 [Gammaproteobacteria bacterium]|nr:hypothetical protein [Gammaproteobacteria bacterium]
MSTFQKMVWLVLVALLTTSTQAQRASMPAADRADSRTLAVQRKVDDLFERGEFERAFFIYRNELAPVGDKYAQYMVGYMHLVGKGTDENPVVASAWYRLAAERGTPEFMAVRDQLMRDLQADERRRSDFEYLRLRHEYSDLAILMDSILDRARELNRVSRPRLAPENSSLNVVLEAQGPAVSRSGREYTEWLRKDLKRRLSTLSRLGNFPDLETDPDKANYAEIDDRVRATIESTPVN